MLKFDYFAIKNLTAAMKELTDYINNDYKPPRPAQPVVYGLQFTKLELAENWHMLTQTAMLAGLFESIPYE